MAGTVLFVLSYQSLTGGLPKNTEYDFDQESAKAVFVGPMTRLFRQAFSRMFDNVREFEIPGNDVTTANATLSLKQCLVFTTRPGALEPTAAPDRLLVLLVEIKPEGGTDYRDVWLNGFRLIEAKLELVRGFGLGDLLDCLGNSGGHVTGQTSYLPARGHERHGACLAAVFAFYVLGWLHALRIERDQMALDLDFVSPSRDTGGQEIARERIRLTNLERFFLTQDRTNDLALREFCVSLVEKYKLTQRASRMLALLHAFEQHLDNTTKLYSARELGSVTNLILILTVLTVPIGFFSALFTISLTSDVLIHPWALVTDARIYLAILLGAAIALLPFGLLKLIDYIRR